ncbi:MAG: rRNA maturation RNase YbeY [Gemmatimonadaceae bacterium]
MTTAVGVSMDGVRVPLSRDRVGTIVRAVLRSEGVKSAMLSVTFVTSQDMRTLTRTHLRRNATTDVIAFGLGRAGKTAPILGDVYIAPEVARASARDHGVTLREELARLIVHGTLHVLGYEHPDGAARTRSAMWRKQERLVARLAANRQ